MQRIKKCSKCKKDFIQKYINYKKQWNRINEIKFWTDDRGWKNYDYFCRSCLKKWFELERESFDSLVSEEKKKLLLDYKYRGTLE